MVQVSVFGATWGPVAWVLMPEQFGLQHRATGVCVGCGMAGLTRLCSHY